jgi:hypothetical protein
MGIPPMSLTNHVEIELGDGGKGASTDDREEGEVETGLGKCSPRKNLETSTLNAGSALLMMWVKDTATFAMLTVAATWPMVCAIATCFSQPRNNY